MLLYQSNHAYEVEVDILWHSFVIQVYAIIYLLFIFILRLTKHFILFYFLLDNCTEIIPIDLQSAESTTCDTNIKKSKSFKNATNKYVYKCYFL